jgi:Protein of unknown function (DUF2735)
MGLVAQTACRIDYKHYLARSEQRSSLREKTMTTYDPRPSAQIIQFPVRYRQNKVEQSDGAKSAFDARSQRFATVASGSGWYHDAAIQETKRAGER